MTQRLFYTPGELAGVLRLSGESQLSPDKQPEAVLEAFRDDGPRRAFYTLFEELSERLRGAVSRRCPGAVSGRL